MLIKQPNDVYRFSVCRTRMLTYSIELPFAVSTLDTVWIR